MHEAGGVGGVRILIQFFCEALHDCGGHEGPLPEFTFLDAVERERFGEELLGNDQIDHEKDHSEPKAPDRFLDISARTGAAARGARMTGFDVSGEMLDAARQKTPDGLDIDWRLASIENTPFADAAFEGATCTLALHHLPDLDAAFREVSRILRPETGRSKDEEVGGEADEEPPPSNS